jgi:hypothetical protein
VSFLAIRGTLGTETIRLTRQKMLQF